MNNRNILLYVLCLVCVVLISLAIQGTTQTEEYTNEGSAPRKSSSEIPKLIWSYWHEETPPPVVEACVDTWRRFCPDYTIHIIHHGNAASFVPKMKDVPTSLSHAHFADMLRIYLLREHGGIWMDATIFLRANLDWVHSLQQRSGAELVGYYMVFYEGFEESHPPVLENWFLACVANSTFVNAWCDEFERAININDPPKYLKELEERYNVDLSTIPEGTRDYLQMHCSAQMVLQTDSTMIDRLALLDARKGPFRYLVNNEWDSIAAVRELCSDDHDDQPLVKMRSRERNPMSQLDETLWRRAFA